MALITRFTRLFRADLHAVLDRVEEPEILLRQAVREMEDDAARDEQRIKVLKHEAEQIEARESDLEQSIVQIDDEIEICFSSGKEDLARGLVKRKLEAQQLLKVLSRRRQSNTDALAKLKARQEENSRRLEAMRQKVDLMTEQQTPRGEASWTIPHVTIRDEDVEVAFLREKRLRGAS